MLKKNQSLIQLLLFIGILIFINILANARLGNTSLYGFIDFTEEKRFTLTEGTQNLLRDLDDVVTIEILLDGDLSPSFKRLKEAVRQTLEDFRSESGYIEYRFFDPMGGTNEENIEAQKTLAQQGIYPLENRVRKADELSLKVIYPYARFYYKGRPAAVNFLKNDVPGMPEEVALENSIGLLEYQFANVIQKLQSPNRKNIVFSTGHGELNPLETRDLENSLRKFYNTDRINLEKVVQIDPQIAALVVAKPRFPFSDEDKFKIDQYVMNGGKVLWLLDALRVDLDSLRREGDYVATDYPTDLSNILFNYGVRLQPNVLLDATSTRIALNTGRVGNAPQMTKVEYPYHPLIIPRTKHPVVKSLGPLNFKFGGTLDTTTQTKTGLRRIPLLMSSENSFMQYNPIRMNFDIFKVGLRPEQFNKGPQMVALAVEGIFPSMYENRIGKATLDTYAELGLTFQKRSLENKMIIVSDGDIAKNKVLNYQEGQIAPLGFNEFENFQFANKEFLLNAIEYLIDTDGLIEARSKEIKLRLLDEVRAQEEKSYWQLLNIGLPVLFIVLFGLGYNFWRRRRFGK